MMGEVYTDLENLDYTQVPVIEQRIKDLVDFNNFKLVSNTGFDHYTIVRFLVRVIEQEIPGGVVELGCHVGETSKILEHVIAHMNPGKGLHVYDSFQGLPDPQLEMGDGFKGGTLKCSRQDVIDNFVRNELRIPIIVEGWFKDAKIVPDQIAFAFFDGDFYGSIKDSFELVWDRIPNGGIIAVHDYFSKALAGVKKATDEFIIDKNHHIVFAHKDQDYGNDIIIIQKG